MSRLDRAVEDAVREPAFEAQNRVARRRAIELLHRDRSGDPRFPWPSADRAVGPFSPGDVVVVGGGPGAFKTGSIGNLESSFLDAGVPWACFGFELDDAVLTQFLAGLRCGLPRDAVREGKLTPAALAALEAEIASLVRRTGEMHFVPDSRMTAGELVTRVRVLVAEMGVRVVFVDHVQHLDFTQEHDLRRGVTEAMHAIKACAKDTGVSFVVASQLARRPGDRLQPWRVPTLSELKESGAIEQLADIVLFVHRQIDPDKRDAARAFAKGESDDPTAFEIPRRLGLTVAKHRFAKPIGVTVPLTIHLPADRITEASDTWEEVNAEDRPIAHRLRTAPAPAKEAPKQERLVLPEATTTEPPPGAGDAWEPPGVVP